MAPPLLLISLGFLLGCSPCSGQAGKKFAFSFLTNHASSSKAHLELFITATQENTKVTVSVPPLNFREEKILNAGQSCTVLLPYKVEPDGSKRLPNTVRVKASADVSVTALNYKSYTGETSVLYPTTEWGQEYFIFTPSSSNGYKEFSITNGKENNKVELIVNGKSDFLDLKPYESVQYRSVKDQSGTRVVSQHPVAVFTGHSCFNMFSRCDHLYEQLLPVNRWGSKFIIPPLSLQEKYDSIYLQASQPTHIVVQNGKTGSKMDFSLSTGEMKMIKTSKNEPLSIQADHGIQVLLLFNGKQYSRGLFFVRTTYKDPFLMTVMPNDQFCSSFSVTSHKGSDNIALIVAQTSALGELRIDGKKLSGKVLWKTVIGTEFSWAEISDLHIYKSGSNQHTVSSSKTPFGLYSISFAQRIGYGSPAQCVHPVGGSTQKLGTCRAAGDPHYQTFDGRRFDFMGTCTYVMAKNCKENGFPAFEVLAQNENRGSLRVSYVTLVTVKVYDITVTVARSEKGRVRINNILGCFPVSLNNDKLKIFYSGRFVVIEADFGLTVRYDWQHYLVVTLSDNYAGQTCGLCGNFNGNPKDDFTTPSGSEAQGAVAFGSSWKVPGLVADSRCRDDCVGGCESCKHAQMKMWEGDKSCGIVTVPNGPFSDCLAVIDPQPYKENCMYDMCMGDGLRSFLCRALETYADACQAAGVKIKDWRQNTKCSPQCPPNSHYELCSSACPATCSDPKAPSSCKYPCVEACTCDTGFVLSGDKCVPETQCGCTYEGQYIPAGESLSVDQGCQRVCECKPGTRQVACSDKACGPGTKCKVVEGIRKCHPVSQSTCRATGDPHYTTFDNRRFDFQGTCVYQLAALCSENKDLEHFEVRVQNNHRGNKRVSFTKLVEIRVYSLNIVITKAYRGQIMVNDVLQDLPIDLAGGQVSVYKSGWYVVVVTSFGLHVKFDRRSAAFVTLPSNYMEAVCGLCGNYNGKYEDDLIPKNSNTAVAPAVFGSSWRVVEVPGCVDSCKGKCPSCDTKQKAQYERKDFCGLITDHQGPFRDCHAVVDPSGHFEDCVYDVCLYNGRRRMLCEAITEYTSACHAAGAKVYSWRTSEFCALKCPVNSHYEVCASSCPATCRDLASPPGCREECAEGCSCDEGYILSGDKCVQLSKCGCVYNDRYYRVGQVFYPNTQCNEECECRTNGEVLCKAFKCGPQEECRVEDGVQKCHPVGKSVCIATGDPHYRSFDGRAFDFQGTCTYTLSKSCGLEGTNLVPFSVLVENAQWERMRKRKAVAVTKMVAVEVYGFTITMKHNVLGVLVDGVFNRVPLNLNDGAIAVYQKGRNVVINTDFGLRVSYNLVYHVTVTVPGNYREKVCGLCGNYNGDQRDDFQTQDKKVTTNINDFGKSWKTSIPGVVCSDGCEGESCPECNPARKAVLSETSYCGFITAPKGPLSVCYSTLDPQSYFNDCVYDVCASDGDEDVLCNSIAAYVADCNNAGVEVSTWRTTSFCPMKCPANSHYEVCADPSSDSCPGLTDIFQSTSTKCTEGCECDTGYLFNGQTCVPETECGCYENGKTYLPGETVYEEGCKTKCTCNPATGLVCEKHSCPKETKCKIKKGIRACYSTDPCKDVKCRKKETCHKDNGEAVCRPDYTGKCWAWGDPHYHTFDGYNFDFQGTCNYIISTTCGNLNGLAPFSVSERNDNRGNTAVSYVREVVVSVSGFNISVVKNQVGQVMVDGERLNLPIELGDGQVSVSQRRRRAVIKTDFGLVVSYDWNWKLVIKLPSSYYGSVCGLCGNFNNNKRDELQNPAGKGVSSVTEWGHSWKIPEQDEEHPCSDTCKGNCPDCDKGQIKFYESKSMCGALTQKKRSVFKVCHDTVDPQPFMENCVYDVCLNKGDKKTLCQALASYVDECEEGGIQIKGWRKQFDCPMDCQPHSHYEECATPCQPSCPFPEQKQICQGVCVEDCVCDSGYVLSAGVCVPANSCGCSYQGRYYRPGQRFWGDDACSHLCECNTILGMVKCSPSSCSAKEQCTTLDGERSCQPLSHAMCSAAGDPHYRTFDGRKFDFMGTCVYQLVALCSQQPGLEPFKVTVQNDHRGSKVVSYTKTVVFSIYGVNITISREHPKKILLNGELTLLPLEYRNELSVYLSGRRAVVKTKAGITVTFDWQSTVRVTLPSNYQSAVCGLCGNYNGNKKDDLLMQNGEVATDGAKLGESWQVALTPGCSSVCQGAQCPSCSDSQKEKYKLQSRCNIIADKEGPFRECHEHVDPAPYLEDCVFDGCIYQGSQASICEAVEVYVGACQALGVNIYPWRTDSYCPMACPANSQYTLCAKGCPATCASSSNIFNCDTHCREACNCAEGYVESGGTCVPVSDCGCSYDGHYYKRGDVFYPDDRCERMCVCGDNGAVSCQEAQCQPGEVCKIVNGVKGCKSESHGNCVASGDPHYTSFDGRRFDFQGTCVYELAKVCDNNNGQLTPFTVTQGNEKFGNGKVAVTESVSVTAYGFVINIQQRKPWKVYVDDELLNLPLSLGDGLVTVTQEGRNIVVRTDFGLTVHYDTVYYVKVIVPSVYKGKMCGLCGNYNNKVDDDFTLPDGKQTTDVDKFGRSWAVDLPGFLCGGCGGQCPVCEEDKAAEYRRADSCGIISAPNGPFKACHSLIDPAPYMSDCVFDVCAANGIMETLCDSVQAYVLACQGVGGKIQPWRNISFCPAFCPKHSHYEACVDTCSGTCAGSKLPSACPEGCFEGCQCDDNLLFDGGQCVPLDNCGCLYEGKYLKVGESIMEKDCKSKCLCQASGLLRCETVSCTSGEVCRVKDGARGCYDKESICNVNQDGHFSTFDGLSGATGVNGAFELASLCDEESWVWFRVVVDLRVCNKGKPPIVATVYVFFRDYVITVNSEYITWVNGRKVSLPNTLGCLLIDRNSGVLIIKRDHVTVTYSISQGVTVVVDKMLLGKMCGVCGNFNQDPKDDLVTADGEATTDVSAVVASWSAEDFSKCGLQ